MTKDKQDKLDDAATDFAIRMLREVPGGDKEAAEAHICAVLILFWSALWAEAGTEFSRGFIEAQLRSMEPAFPVDRLKIPRVQ